MQSRAANIAKLRCRGHGEYLLINFMTDAAPAVRREAEEDWPHSRRTLVAFRGALLASARLRFTGVQRLTHINRRISSEEIFTRWGEYINDLGIFGEEAFVFNVSSYYCNVAPDHRPPFVSHAKIHPALKDPNNLFVRVLMRCRRGTGFQFPPHNHSVLSGKHASLNFIVDTFPRQFRDRTEARYNSHGLPSLH
jgi:hypothetical protein